MRSCTSFSDPEGGRAGLDFEASTKVVHRGPARHLEAGTSSNQHRHTMSGGADKNNGLGEAFSGSSSTAAEHRGMMVSSTSPPAVRIIHRNSRAMIAKAQAHCNSGSAVWTRPLASGRRSTIRTSAASAALRSGARTDR